MTEGRNSKRFLDDTPNGKTPKPKTKPDGHCLAHESELKEKLD